MSTIPEYQRGYQDAMKAAVTWLHVRARSMNDPHEQRVLDSAAFNLGTDTVRKPPAALADTGSAEHG